MTDTIELEVALKRANVSRKQASCALGISVTAFFQKLHNQTEFKASEINKLAEMLSLSPGRRDAIFFKHDVG